MEIVLEMTLITCCAAGCGLVFAVPCRWEVKRRDDHTSFYCPNGHRQNYQGESDLEKANRLRRERELELQATINEERHLRLVAENAAAKAIKDKRKVERRIAHGICPCCNKTFADVANHMVTEHKDFRLPEGKKLKQLTA